MPANILEKPVSKKRRTGPSMELNQGEPSEKRETPQISVAIAMAEPTLAKPKITPNIVIDLGDPLQTKENGIPKIQNS